MKTDLLLQKEVEEQLRFDPRLNATQIGVTCEDGAITLRGTVDSYAQRYAAEEAVRSVSGVRAIAQDLKVKLTEEHERDDAELAEAAAQALEWDVRVPESVVARVENGWLTLEGSVRWNFEREAAESALRNMKGVQGFTNLISILPTASAVPVSAVKSKIESALQRRASEDARHIKVAVIGNEVTLEGLVHSWQEHDDITAAAWCAPGVTSVVDKLSVTL